MYPRETERKADQKKNPRGVFFFYFNRDYIHICVCMKLLMLYIYPLLLLIMTGEVSGSWINKE